MATVANGLLAGGTTVEEGLGDGAAQLCAFNPEGETTAKTKQLLKTNLLKN
jgi:hypothetical protein